MAKGINPLSRLLILLGLERDPTTVSPEDRILQSYYEKLTVFPVNKSRVITIEFSSADPDLAARAANTIADLYIEAQSDGQARQRPPRPRLRSQSLLADLRTRAADAEAKADAFRSQSGLLVGTNNNTITAQQLADISTQLAQARTAEADAQAKAKLLREMIRQGRISEVPDVANNELIRRISEQRVNLAAEIALQSRTLLPGHPHMQELNAQLRNVDTQLRAAGEKAVRTLENDARHRGEPGREPFSRTGRPEEDREHGRRRPGSAEHARTAGPAAEGPARVQHDEVPGSDGAGERGLDSRRRAA